MELGDLLSSMKTFIMSVTSSRANLQDAYGGVPSKELVWGPDDWHSAVWKLLAKSYLHGILKHTCFSME